MENKKKILLVVPRFNIGGAETYVMTLALLLHRQGFHVHVASAGGGLTEILEQNGIMHHFVPVRLNINIASRMLARLIERYQIDLIHANSAAAGIVAVNVKKMTGIPVVYTAHGIFGHDQKEMTLAKCDKIICVSEFVRQFALKKGFPADKLCTGYTGIDLDKFLPDAKIGQEMREQLDIPQDVFVLTISARMKNMANKGHLDILRVLKEFTGAKKWHLIVIGKGKAFWQLKYLIWRWKLGNRVHCVGHQVDVTPFINAADAVVLPSRFETFGLAIAEGMAMEKAAVAYAVGGTPEVIADNQTGYLAKVNNLADLYEKLACLAVNPAKRLAMGKRGRKMVADHFSCEQMIKSVRQIYQEVMVKEGCDRYDEK